MTKAIESDALEFTEVAAPSTPASGKVRVYAKTDKKMYRKGSDGTEVELGGGSSGSQRTFAFFAG